MTSDTKAPVAVTATRSGLRALWEGLKPYVNRGLSTLAGRFPHQRWSLTRKTARILVWMLLGSAALFVFAVMQGRAYVYIDAYQIWATHPSAWLSVPAAVSLLFIPRKPVLGWQISLASLVLIALVPFHPDGLLSVVSYVALVHTLNIAMLTPRPHRWVVTLTSLVIILCISVVLGGNILWAVPVGLAALVIFVVDNHQAQRQASAHAHVAEQQAQRAHEQAEEATQEVAATKSAMVQLSNQEAVLRERTRIARDLHDVVAHHMSMVVVRAQTAQYRLPEVSEPVRQEFADVADLARQSLAEVRELLTVLRSDTEVILAPQPDLTDVPELIADAQESGMQLTYEPPEPLPELSAAVSMAAYRIIQEGLANARRHAPGAHTEVTVLCQRQHLVVSVYNEASLIPPTPTGEETSPTSEPAPGEATEVLGGDATEILGNSDSCGHGLLGIRERVHAAHGTMTSGPTSEGGYLLYVRMPRGVSPTVELFAQDGLTND